MTIEYIAVDKLPKTYYDGVKRLLVLTDEEFFPPLSVRSGTTQSDFHPDEPDYSAGGDSITLYFQALLKQSFILAVADGEIAGFLSYIRNHVADGVDISPENAYVSTICVAPAHRRRGIASTFYDKLEADERIPFVFTRTWGQNDSHIYLLKRRDYEKIAEFADDRATGVDTVYYAKKMGD